MRNGLAARFSALLLLVPMAALAHVGNPDIYFDGQAGPYRLFVTVRPPLVIPGVADIEVRTSNSHVQSLHAVPVPLDAEESKFAPVPDSLKVSGQDRQFFTGSLWIMAAGSWQVRITADGTDGRANVAVPVPSVPRTTKKMQWGLGALLIVMMLLLVGGLVVMSGASVREAQLEPGAEPSEAQEKRARRAMAICFAIVAVVLAFGGSWWNASEAQYRRNIFSPLGMRADLNPDGMLRLSLSDAPVSKPSGRARLERAFFTRTTDDLVADHDHLMHLYVIREPGLDVVYHLHPQRTGPGEFDLQMPNTESGQYNLYADIVHANGFPETLVANIKVPPGLPGRALAGDDARGSGVNWQAAPETNTFRLPDGYTMTWNRPGGTLRANQLQEFRFTLLDPRQRGPIDMRLYMGMTGHAAFVKTDGTAFAHIHPAGSVSMASLMMAQNQLREKANEMDMSNMDMAQMDASQMNHASMNHSTAVQSAVPNEVAFPYGFPTAGRYRIFVQMKHGDTVETGIFDATAQ